MVTAALWENVLFRNSKLYAGITVWKVGPQPRPDWKGAASAAKQTWSSGKKLHPLATAHTHLYQQHSSVLNSQQMKASRLYKKHVIHQLDVQASPDWLTGV